MEPAAIAIKLVYILIDTAHLDVIKLSKIMRNLSANTLLWLLNYDCLYSIIGRLAP